MSHDETDDAFDGPSRSQLRREAMAIFKMAETLATLSDAQLVRIPLEPALIEEVRRTRAIPQPIARKRQTQYLAKLLRRLEDEEIAAVRTVLDSDRQQSNRETAALHQLEAWRDRLVAEGDSALDELLLVHPDDAAARGLREGAPARVRSRVGTLVVPVEISDEMMPGVVSLPHGFGHTEPGTRTRVAAERQPGVNANVLTDTGPIDVPSGTGVANGIPVEVAAAG